MSIVVVSTGLSEVGAPCLESVARAGVEHLWRVGPREALANVWEMVSGLPGETVVAWVDGDDWILPGALDRVWREYANDDDVWCTWGSYVTADGRKGVSGPYREGENIRRSEWRASHLKTFRAGLFRAIPHDELTADGRWLTRAIDLAVMFPAIELAGLDRCRFIPDVIYTYNYQASFEKSATSRELAHERSVAEWIRRRKPLARLGDVSWR